MNTNLEVSMNSSRRARGRRQGSVLILVLIMLMLIGAMVGTLTLTMRGQADGAVQSRELVQSLLDADVGLARAKARLQYEFTDNYAAQSPDLKGMAAGASHDAWMITPEGATIDLTCLKTTSTYMDFRVTSSAAAAGPTSPAARRVELVVRIRFVLTSTPIVGSGAGAIVAFGPVSITGAFEVDGRDHPADDFDTVLPATGAPGISTTDTLTIVSGATKVGGTSSAGDDAAPTTRKDGVTEGVHYDASSIVWNPESGDDATDGLDNDDDGLVDETSGAPGSADEYLGQDPGGLKAAAQATGTYFTSLAAYNTYVKTEGNTSNGIDDDGDGVIDDDGSAASGKILYLEVPNGSVLGGGAPPDDVLELPKNDAADGHAPAIVVVAGADPTIHDTQVGPVHANNGTFQGVLIADRIINMNGNGALIGQVVTFPDPALGPSLGAGTFNVYFSNEVLGNLPTPSTSSTPTDVVEDVQLWRELAPR